MQWPGHDIPWLEWQRRYFPHVATAEPAPYHAEFWEWIQALTPGIAPPAFVGCWFRGAGKTTTVELGVTYAGANLKRRFALLVGKTQADADERVKAIGEHFTDIGIRNATNDLGYSLGWRADQLRTENGFNVVGVGLDKAIRGIKLGKYRPDWIIFDDIDDREDTPNTIKKKVRAITDKILKAGSVDLAATFVQNLIFKGSIMWQVVNGAADFLLDRNAAKVIKAVEGLQVEQEPRPEGLYRWRVTGGVPTWVGFPLTAIEADINRAGYSSFKRESQQDVEEEDGGLWDRTRDIRYWHDEAARLGFDPNELPDFQRIVVAVDPSGSARGDEVGVGAAGLLRLSSGLTIAVVLDDVSDHMGPKEWAQRAVSLFRKREADKLLAESNFGGEMVAATVETADEREEDGRLIRKAPSVTLVRVSRGKIIRAEPIQGRYEEGRVLHARRFIDLESQLCTWHPESGQPSPGRLDWVVIALSELFGIADYVHPEKPKPATPRTVPTIGRW